MSLFQGLARITLQNYPACKRVLLNGVLTTSKASLTAGSFTFTHAVPQTARLLHLP